LDQKKFDALLDKVKPVAARESHDLAQLLDWMNKNGLAIAALKWSEKLPVDRTNRPPVAIAVAEALVQTKNWSRLRRWSRSGPWGDDDYLRLAYQAYAVRRSHRTAESEAEFDALWNSAAAAAAAQPEHRLALARLASTWNLTPEAEQLWLNVAKVPSTRREALDALYSIYRETNDLPNLRLTTERLHETSPEEVGLAANAARFALLLDHNAAASRALAKKAYEKAPNDPTTAVTYAFALYGIGQTAEGIKILETLPPDQLNDPHTAVYAALLYDDENQLDAANNYIAMARNGPIFPEEKQLLEEITTRRKNAADSLTPSPSPD
jgi:hypothetical protein